MLFRRWRLTTGFPRTRVGVREQLAQSITDTVKLGVDLTLKVGLSLLEAIESGLKRINPGAFS